MDKPQAPDLNQAETPPAETPPKEKQPAAEAPNGKKDESKPRDWEASFKGLQKTVQNQAEELTGIKTLLSDISGKIPTPEEPDAPEPETAEDHIKLLSQQVDKITTDLQQAQAASLEQARVNRKLSMLSETPEVLPFANSIPTLDDEVAQKEAINSFTAQLSDYASTKVVPPKSAPPATPTPAQSEPADAKTKAQVALDAWNKGVEDNLPSVEIAKLRDDFFAADKQSGFLGDSWAFKSD